MTTGTAGVAAYGSDTVAASEVRLPCVNPPFTTTSNDCFQLPVGTPSSQGVVVELSQTNGSGARFVHDSAWVSMNFVNPSTSAGGAAGGGVAGAGGSAAGAGGSAAGAGGSAAGAGGIAAGAGGSVAGAGGTAAGAAGAAGNNAGAAGNNAGAAGGQVATGGMAGPRGWGRWGEGGALRVPAGMSRRAARPARPRRTTASVAAVRRAAPRRSPGLFALAFLVVLRRRARRPSSL